MERWKSSFDWNNRVSIHLDRPVVAQLKGLAIFLIVLHNFFHSTFSKTKENEFDFAPDRFLYFLNELGDRPEEWVQAFFAYFGHFGVQIFIFLSAYSLALSYPEVRSPASFFLSRVRKLYPFFVGAILLWSLVSGYSHYSDWNGPLLLMQKHAEDLALLLSAVFPWPSVHLPMVAPWWFIPYIMQFYLLWALSSALVNRAPRAVLLLVILAGLVFNHSVLPLALVESKLNLLFTPLGHIPEIFTGIYLAKYDLPRPALVLMFPVALVGLYFSGLYEELWSLHHVSGLIVFLFLSAGLLSLAGARIAKPLFWLGGISLPLFLVNGFLRDPFIALYYRWPTWETHMGCAILFFLAVCLLAYFLTKLVHWVERALVLARRRKENSPIA